MQPETPSTFDVAGEEDFSEAHSDTFVFQSASCGRFVQLNNDELFLSKRYNEAKPTPILLFFNQLHVGDLYS